MALPRERDSYELYTDQVVYFGARLAANPETASLAEVVDKLVDELDEAYVALRDARRAEMRARARRDHQDGLGDQQVRRFKRRIDVFGDANLTQRLFPRGVTHAVAPRGRAQVERLSNLVIAIEELASSPRVAAHVDVDEINEILAKGKATVMEARDSLGALVDDCEAEALNVARAVDGFGFLRGDGVARLGAVVGELRAKLGGDSKAAYAYTLSRGEGGGRDEASDEDVAEPNEAPAEA